jgi:alkanesulfonate monooxygenase SsuD/methylene tetrahydromethanopterin reductase-like flavin-dependent oxidoreductase (luciferase family)
MFDQSEQPGGLAPGALYESRLALLEFADRVGFWGYHKSEHHMIPLDHAPNVGIFLGAAAQRTTTMRLCSLVHLLPFQHPIRLIEDVCMLDHLTGGRFEFGFGKGVSPPEHQLWGLDPAEAVATTDEMLTLLLAALTCPDETFSFDGEFFNLADVPLELRPLQQPYPPLWRPGTVATAARLGVSTLAGGPIDRVAQSLETYRAEYRPGIGGGHQPTVGALRKFIVAPTDAEADEIGRRAWPVYSANLGKLFRAYDVPIPNDPTVGGDYELAKHVQAVVVGSPERVRDHVEQLRAETGVEYVVGGFAFGDLSHDEALRSLELFAEHVVEPLATGAAPPDPP